MATPLAPHDVSEILAALRAGASISTPGSRCHSSFGFADGGWYREDFDEGATVLRSIDEAAVRSQLADTPEIGRELLRRRRWQQVRAAVATGDHAAAAVALDAWRSHGGEEATALIVTAALRTDEAPLDTATATAVRQRFADGTLLHVFGELHGWPNDAAGATRCLAFIDALLRRLGEPADDRSGLRARLQQRMND